MPVEAKRPKSHPARKEHGLFRDAFTQAKLKQYAEDMKAWRYKHGPVQPWGRDPMHPKDFAEKIGCSQQQIRNIESGISAPSYAIMAAIFRHTGIQPIR